MFKFKLILSTLLLVLFIACNNEEQLKLIIGSWQCIQWDVADKTNAINPENVSFKFNSDKTYEYHNSSLNESGTYKISGNKLYTTPKGELEMAVEIVKISKDSMLFNMSRGGTPEMMVLVKKN